MKNEETKQNDSVRVSKTDIEIEGQAIVMTFLLAACAILVCFLVGGVCFGIYELIMWLLSC